MGGGKDVNSKIKDAVQKFMNEFPDVSLQSSGHQNNYSEKMRLWAMQVMSGMRSSEGETMLPLWYNLDIRDPVTSKIGTCRPQSVHDASLMVCTAMVAAAHRSRSLLENPRLSSPHPQRNVEWELHHAITLPLCIIEQLRDDYAVSGALAGVDPLAAARDALGSIHTFLLGMDWNSPQRDLGLESWHYRKILEFIVKIHGNEHTRNLIIPTLVEALTSAFSSLIAEDDWENTVSTDWDVRQCRDILVQLCSTVGISSSS